MEPSRTGATLITADAPEPPPAPDADPGADAGMDSSQRDDPAHRHARRALAAALCLNVDGWRLHDHEIAALWRRDPGVPLDATAAAPPRLLALAPAAAPPPPPPPPPAPSPARSSPAPAGLPAETATPALDVAAMVAVLRLAARDGVPFCEECARAAAQREGAGVGA